MRGYKKYFTKWIRHNFPDEFNKVSSSTELHYRKISQDTRFVATSANPIDKRLDFSACFLALIKTLDEKGETFQTIRKICLDVVTDYVRPKNKIQGVIKQIFPKITNTWFGQRVIRSLHKRVSVNANPDGFIASIITDKRETFGLGYGVDILECGICKLFQKHNAKKYASILCEVDEITSGLAGLELIRTGTIANGATKCDFRFKRK